MISGGDVIGEIVPQLDERMVPLEVAPHLAPVVRDAPLTDLALGERPPDHVAVMPVPRSHLVQRHVVGLSEVPAEIERVPEFLLADGTPAAWLPDGYSQIFRCVWPCGHLDYGSATLRCKI